MATDWNRGVSVDAKPDPSLFRSLLATDSARDHGYKTKDRENHLVYLLVAARSLGDADGEVSLWGWGDRLGGYQAPCQREVARVKKRVVRLTVSAPRTALSHCLLTFDVTDKLVL
ncbi:hypothetical protein F2Q68_00024808 [Brassica cretica]|uniref:Uncharacterized protein n=1 Tax=Brassica cretica TaxID=69181 RepID=A0A8S9IIC2_BRACR|nr:hypothetical protein F2Q68_00024808 [Brassica cretica]